MKIELSSLVARRRLSAAGLLCLVSLMGGTALAQTTGTIYGTVTDPSGLAVPNATVVATHNERGTTRNATTGAQGEFVLPLLPAGVYTLRLEASGFKKVEQKDIEISPNSNVRADAKMELGSLAESVNVTGEAPLVDSRSSTLGTLIDPRRVLELPMNGRNVVGLAVLLPGVSAISAPQTFTGDRSGPTITVSGSRANDTLFLLDGADYNAIYRNNGLNLPPPDALQEVKVLTNTFSAEYGRNSGAVFQAVSRSGTNEIHGSVWEFLRNQKLNARNFFAASTKPQLIQNQFGAAAGGPIKKDKLFVFASFEGLRIRPASLATSAYPLTAAERNGDFSGSAAIRDPLTKLPFPGNQIPSSRFDTVSHNVLTRQELMPLPNQPDGGLVFTFPSPSTNNTVLARADYNLRKHTIDGRFNYNRAQQTTFSGNVPAYGTTSYSTPTYSVTVGDTWVVTPNVLNQMRVGFNRFFPGFTPVNPFHMTDLGGKFPMIVDVPPSLSLSGRLSLASGGFETDLNQTWQFNDSIQWTKGAHSIKAGLEIFRYRYYYESSYLGQGSYSFTGAMTGNSAADFVLGRPASLTVGSPMIKAGVKQFNIYPYFQDDWKITRRLTLNLGLRYELSLAGMYPNHDLASTFRFGQQSQVIKNAPTGIVFPGDPGIPDSTMPTDKNNFAPRVGLAWDPFGNGRTSVRAGWGIFYELMTAEGYDNNLNQPVRYVFTVNAPPSLTDPLLGYPAIPLVPTGDNPLFVGLPSLWYVDPQMRTPYVQHYNLNVQHEIVKDLLLQVGYVGKQGRKLPLSLAGNPAVPGPGASLSNIDDRRIYPGFGDNSEITAQTNSYYNSLQVEATRRYRGGFSLQGAYTFSRATDQFSSISLGTQIPNIFDLRSQRGLADGSAKHIGSFSWIWDLPKLQSANSVVRFIAGNWQWNGLVTAQSGSPFNLQLGSDAALSGTPNQRPSVIGDPSPPGDRAKGDKILAWFNRSAFVAPALGTYGNVARNALLGPGSTTANAGLFKTFKLPGREGLRMQFRSEFFNILNHTNLSNPNASLSSGVRMGRITSAGSARVIQFALKLSF